MSTLPELTLSDSPEDWLRFAEADLALASAPWPTSVPYELLCFHAQQAVEKGVKAVLVLWGISFAWTHILERLIDLLPAELARPVTLIQSAKLTVYATMVRYPGGMEPATEEEHREAVRLAEVVVDWARTIIHAGASTP